MLQYSGKTDTGRKRRDNQDSFRIDELSENALLLVVCDGVGGVAGGNIASNTAVDSFTEYIRPRWAEVSGGDGETICGLLRDAASRANRDVYDKANAEPSLAGMGTTLVAAILDGKHMYIANIGDSRLYLVEYGEINKLTRDHSYVQYLVDIGQLTPEEAAVSPKRNIIIRAIGGAEVETDTFCVEANGEDDRYVLLCSDGLTDYLSESDILGIIIDGGLSLDDKTDSLIEGANRGGGGDNITAVLAKW